jgi:hypothetical protein
MVTVLRREFQGGRIAFDPFICRRAIIAFAARRNRGPWTPPGPDRGCGSPTARVAILVALLWPLSSAAGRSPPVGSRKPGASALPLMEVTLFNYSKCHKTSPDRRQQEQTGILGLQPVW